MLDTLLNSGDDDADDADGAAADPAADSGEEEEDEGSFIYETIEQFRADSIGDTDEENLENVIGIDVKSQYYMTRVTVTRDEITVTQYTTFFRDNNGALQAIRRSRGGI